MFLYVLPFFFLKSLVIVSYGFVLPVLISLLNLNF